MVIVPFPGVLVNPMKHFLPPMGQVGSRWSNDGVRSSRSALMMRQAKTLPKETLGYRWLEFLERESLIVPDTKPDMQSWCQNLDVGLHLLTGYETDAAGIAEVQAFLFGATGEVINLLRCFELFYRIGQQRLTSHSTLYSVLTLRAVWWRLYKAYWRGYRSCFDFDTWQPESLWDLPLKYVQRWFGIAPSFRAPDSASKKS